ncbi:MAG TPA: membrane protein insertase YidC [Longimicrobiales bacterium]|nr:membrane protein insertase YidC [Longimicrobiales bacterium]
MSTQLRFVLAMALMFLVLFAPSLLFRPPPGATPTPGADTVAVAPSATPPGTTGVEPLPPAVPELPSAEPGVEPAPPGVAAEPERTVVVEGPLYRYEFTTYGARLVSAALPQFPSLNREGVVDLVPEQADGYLGTRFVVGSDTLDLSRVPFEVVPEDGLTLHEGGPRDTLTFVYRHPTGDLQLELSYAFDPMNYDVQVHGRVTGLDRPLLLTELGDGLAFAEADSASEARMMAYVYNHLDEGIVSRTTRDAEPTVVQGPLLWTAFRNKYFLIAMLAGASDELASETDYLGGLIVRQSQLPERVNVEVAQGIGNDGRFAYRLFLGPQEYTRLSSLGQGMEQVNPYGWRFFRPIIRPFVAIILAVMTFLHTTLNIGYGWVLIVFAVAMRILLWPLNQRAMKAQLRNMAFQPRVAEVQRLYKNDPERLQKEIKKLYAEGFNPLGGCLPLLLPWPILIALFFVFQNTIDLRGVAFLWLPDLSAKDPLYILPIMLGVSMFFMQWISMRSVDQQNPQMKMMLWLMPGMMLFIFLNLASGLNVYYVASNIATIPQQVWIAKERKKVRAQTASRPSGG